MNARSFMRNSATPASNSGAHLPHGPASCTRPSRSTHRKTVPCAESPPEPPFARPPEIRARQRNTPHLSSIATTSALPKPRPVFPTRPPSVRQVPPRAAPALRRANATALRRLRAPRRRHRRPSHVRLVPRQNLPRVARNPREVTPPRATTPRSPAHPPGVAASTAISSRFMRPRI